MIPDLENIAGALWPVLPPGIHRAPLTEVAEKFATNAHRKRLFDGFMRGVHMFKAAGCKRIFLDGSFVTAKPLPNDYDACWDVTGIDEKKIDPVMWNFEDKRKAQKERYLGEYFPMHVPADGTGKVFLDFFQTERNSGERKGILEIILSSESL